MTRCLAILLALAAWAATPAFAQEDSPQAAKAPQSAQGPRAAKATKAPKSEQGLQPQATKAAKPEQGSAITRSTKASQADQDSRPPQPTKAAKGPKSEQGSQAAKAPQTVPNSQSASGAQPASGAQSGQAAQAPDAQAQASRPSALSNLGANNKEPIKIDADRLDVFDKEQRAVFTGSVVAVQGESTIRCTEMTVLYEQQRGAPRAAAATPPGKGDSAIKRIDCKGPVTIVSKTQTATGDDAVFDRATNKIHLTGNVALSDGPNVTTGERLVYDLNTGIANVETKPGGRVRALFVPGSNPDVSQTNSSAADKQQSRRAPATN